MPQAENVPDKSEILSTMLIELGFSEEQNNEIYELLGIMNPELLNSNRLINFEDFSFRFDKNLEQSKKEGAIKNHFIQTENGTYFESIVPPTYQPSKFAGEFKLQTLEGEYLLPKGLFLSYLDKFHRDLNIILNLELEDKSKERTLSAGLVFFSPMHLVENRDNLYNSASNYINPAIESIRKILERLHSQLDEYIPEGLQTLSQIVSVVQQPGQVFNFNPQGLPYMFNPLDKIYKKHILRLRSINLSMNHIMTQSTLHYYQEGFIEQLNLGPE